MFLESGLFWLSAVLALSVPIILIGGFHNRLARKEPRGIGWKFIRFTVVTISIPIIGVLALNNALSGEAAALLAGAMGYAFGKKADGD
jgi:hypothetical protein